MNVDNGAKFDLGAEAGKSNGEGVTLSDILGGINKPIMKGKEVKFEIKLNNDDGQNTSQLSLTMNYKGKQAFAKNKLLDWSKV